MKNVLTMLFLSLLLFGCHPADPTLGVQPAPAPPPALPSATKGQAVKSDTTEVSLQKPLVLPGATKGKSVVPDTKEVASQKQLPPPPPPKVIQYPINSVAAVAYEDESPKSDEDFNDFLTNFKIVEKVQTVNGQTQITDIIMDFYPRAVGGSYDHSFLVVLNGIKESPSNITLKTTPMFNGQAKITLTRYDANGKVLGSPEDNLPSNKDLVIFPSTHALFTNSTSCNNRSENCEIINTDPSRPYQPPSQSARLQISLLNPELNKVSDADMAAGKSGKIDMARFRMILHVKPTNHDMEIIDVDPTNTNDNFDQGTHNSYPYGFVIPTNWRWPAEGKKIDDAYPSFTGYRNYLNARKSNPAATVLDATLNWFNIPGVESKLYKSVPQPKLLPDP